MYESRFFTMLMLIVAVLAMASLKRAVLLAQTPRCSPTLAGGVSPSLFRPLVRS